MPSVRATLQLTVLHMMTGGLLVVLFDCSLLPWPQSSILPSHYR